MRSLAFGLIGALLFLSPLTAASAAPAPAASPTPAPVRALWDYKSELGLTDKQVTDIKAQVVALEAVVNDAQGKLKVLNDKLVGQINGYAQVELIKPTLDEMAAIQVQLKLADIRTSRAINGIMTPAQLTKWHTIQKAANP